MGSDDLPAQVGEVRGRLSALEARMTRHEDAMNNKLSSMDGKLDTIVSRLDRQDGASATSTEVAGWAKALICGAIPAGLVWVAQHLGLK